MKTLRTLAVGLILVACSMPEALVPPEQDALFRIDRVETFTGIDATRKTLEAVSRELRDPYALATAAALSGQTTSERRELLTDMTEALERKLHDHELASPTAGACVVHANPRFRTRYTTAWIGTGDAIIGGATSTDRTTQIRNSVYTEIGRGIYPDPEDGRGLTTISDLACGDDLYTNVRMTFSVSVRDHKRSFWLWAETAHILPTVAGGMSWTRDTDECTMERPSGERTPLLPVCL